MNKNAFKRLYKIGIVVLLIFIVGVVLIIKNKKPQDMEIGDVTMDSSTIVNSVKQDSFAQIKKPDTATAKVSQDDSLVGQAVPVPPEVVKDIPSLAQDILANINGEAITIAQFNSIFNDLPAQNKEYFKDDKAGFLEELIVRQLLLQDANREKIHELPEYKTAIVQNPNQIEEIIINLLIKQIIADVSVTESELKEFFEQSENQLPNKDYESVKEQLRPMAQEEKQRLAIEAYINKLKSNAQITRNEKWIKTQEALTADNPLNKALELGQPVVADFGRGTCMPCKMMEPILKKLEKEYRGRVSILILDIDEYRSLSRKYRVMIIPTQIFFDSDGKEVYRHQGFMSETAIIVKLRDLGVE